LQGVEKPGRVARVKTNRWLIENIKHTAEIRAQLSSQPDSLRLTSAEGVRSSIQGQVVQADLAKKTEALTDFTKDICGNFLITPTEFETANDLEGVVRRLVRDAVNRLALKENTASRFIDSRSVAGQTWSCFAVVARFMAALFRQLRLEEGVEFFA
jgi:hypothetical protein